MTLGAAVAVLADPGGRAPTGALLANPSKAIRDSAVRSIPWDKLDRNARAKVQAVLATTSVFRRLPSQLIHCDPQMYLFLVHHPNVVVDVWRVLGLTQMVMDVVDSNTFRLDDGAGTRGTIEYLYRSSDLQLVYVDGSYSGPPFPKPIEGHGILILKSGCVQGSDGRHYISSRLDAFISVEPGAAEILTKTMQPLVGKIADMNFAQTVGFVASLSRTAEVNPDGMQRLAKRLPHVPPEVRQRFAQLCSQVAVRSKEAASTGVQVPLMAGRSKIVDTPSTPSGAVPKSNHVQPAIAGDVIPAGGISPGQAP